ncbi:hypothetical protein B0H16DRAFT_1757330 [Mycena metata]|uniref:Uncharacterized protein n=1 Tax=Mycena metata TaxID=1033252 RepID=A0AAD7IGD5_9AGAR|nr:hypothetical protein B0H16DRAFT_1757330 [Mycena metata]
MSFSSWRRLPAGWIGLHTTDRRGSGASWPPWTPRRPAVVAIGRCLASFASLLLALPRPPPHPHSRRRLPLTYRMDVSSARMDRWDLRALQSRSPVPHRPAIPVGYTCPVCREQGAIRLPLPSSPPPISSTARSRRGAGSGDAYLHAAACGQVVSSFSCSPVAFVCFSASFAPTPATHVGTPRPQDPLSPVFLLLKDPRHLTRIVPLASTHAGKATALARHHERFSSLSTPSVVFCHSSLSSGSIAIPF